MTNELYDLGYMDLSGKIELLEKALRELGAVVVDVRHSPRSRNPVWNKGALKERFGAAYVHIPNLGNRNYDAADQPIEYVNLADGLVEMSRIMLIQDKPVIVMCGCWDREHCHRLGIVQAYAEKFSGVASISLSKKAIEEIATRNEPKQKGLFDE